MTALLYRTSTGWHLMLTVSDIRGPFALSSISRLAYAHGWKIKRSPNLDQP